MDRRLPELALSVVTVMLVLLVLWPPTDVFPRWWTVLPETLQGDLPLLALLLGFGTIAGSVLTAIVGIRPQYLLAGGMLAYVGSLVVIEVRLTPESPVHWVLYGVIFVGILCGGLAGVGLTDENQSVLFDQDSA